MSVSTQYYVYILTNTIHTVLYVGVTNDLWQRVAEHRAGKATFTARYNVHKLVHYEGFLWIQEAIAREKQLKAGSRQKKMDLIREFNPLWKDLAAGDEPAAD
ncbi:MAG: GIY-YIG nuclease family protein [Hymenobacteraceae bacterium]|nr:GIY-YIG nuclease family protein [Hymenobacteraceae bacterium]